jgi:cellulose synthase/poly-beta-1,6-N-acetylglucosamine synthase-like glycosyltransferase
MLVALSPGPTLQKTTGAADSSPQVLILVPVRNEARSLPRLLLALDKLEYPDNRLTIVFVDDGSTDDSDSIIRHRLQNKPNWHLLSSRQNLGKATALSNALLTYREGEVIVIYDADERPRPSALRCLINPFGDRLVGGVSGRRAVINGRHSPVASYIAFEGLVHQLVTMRAKDRLDLAPALLGSNCAYRRQALAEAGGFKPGALLEDSDLTLKLVRAGWKIRFEPAALSYHRVPETVSGYWQQHTRWARGFNDVLRDQAGAVLFDRHLPARLRLELLIFSLGYLDRLALAAAAGLAWIRPGLMLPVVTLSLLTPLLQVLAALKVAGELQARYVGRPGPGKRDANAHDDEITSPNE